MNRILDWLKPDAKTHARIEQKNAVTNLVAFHSGGHPAWSSISDGNAARNGFCRNPIVYRCVSLISQAASSVPLQICEDGVDCDQHPVLELLARPNPRQSGAKLLECLYGHLLISGNAYLTKLHLGEELRELHALDPQRVSVVDNENGWPTRYSYTTDGNKIIYHANGDNADILHMGLFNPVDDVTGLSPLSASHMALDIHNAASEWNKALLDNSARPSGALVYASTTGDNLSDEQFDRLKSELEEGYSGLSRAGRPMVLEGGLDWKAMGYSPRDMDFLQAKNGAAREIALAFGVPPMLLGIPGDNTYANYQEANRAFWIQTVMPLVEKTAADIGNWLIDDLDGSTSLHAASDRLDALAHERDAQWNRIGQASFLTDDEKREALGFAALDPDTTIAE